VRSATIGIRRRSLEDVKILQGVVFSRRDIARGAISAKSARSAKMFKGRSFGFSFYYNRRFPWLLYHFATQLTKFQKLFTVHLAGWAISAT
jgi:hypothetical protein